MHNVNLNGINSNMNLSETKNKKDVKAKEDTRPQVKEHCSSKAGMALKNVALGVMLAASVIAGAKATTVPVKAENTQPVDNSTSVSQQAEVSAEKTDIEMAVDEAMQTESRTSTIYANVGGKVDCEGEMTNGDRCYEKASISEDGVLTFYDQKVHNEIVSQVVVNPNGGTSIVPRTETKFTYDAKNAFNLGTSTSNNEISLKAGERFEEVSSKNGDYVELAEDGTTFNVYDEAGNQIGSCRYMTPEQHEQARKNENQAMGIVAGTVALGAAGVVGVVKVVDKISDKIN